jgi:hypothetical protein
MAERWFGEGFTHPVFSTREKSETFALIANVLLAYVVADDRFPVLIDPWDAGMDGLVSGSRQCRDFRHCPEIHDSADLASFLEHWEHRFESEDSVDGFEISDAAGEAVHTFPDSRSRTALPLA